jgi:tyrosyl-tRNA synthetase
MTPLLVGTDGVQKMSKSLGNYIGVAEPPEVIYGKTMSIRDDFILNYFELLTDVPDTELKEFKEQLDGGENPMTLKKRLARDLVTQLHSSKKADEAEKHFQKVVQNKEVPDDMPTINCADASPDIRRLLVANGLCASMGEAVRLINQGAVRIDGEKVTGFSCTVKSGCIIQVGKRQFARLILDS